MHQASTMPSCIHSGTGLLNAAHKHTLVVPYDRSSSTQHVLSLLWSVAIRSETDRNESALRKDDDESRILHTNAPSFDHASWFLHRNHEDERILACISNCKYNSIVVHEVRCFPIVLVPCNKWSWCLQKENPVQVRTLLFLFASF